MCKYLVSRVIMTAHSMWPSGLLQTVTAVSLWLRKKQSMTGLSLLLTASLISACAQFQIPDLHPWITLPASGDCYSMSTVSHERQRLPADSAACDRIHKRSVSLVSDDWATLKRILLTNCLTNECQQSVGALDTLFRTVDNSLKALPAP